MKTTLRRCSICMLVFALLIFNGCTRNVDLNRVEKKKTITLIAKMKSGDYWNTVKMGADAAAREFGVNVEFAAPQDEQDIEEQKRLMNLAIEQKVGAIVLAAGDFTALVEVTEKAYDQHLPVIMIDSEVNTQKYHSYISTDNVEAGKKAGEKLVEIAGGNCRVAIMNFVQGSRNAQEREAGVLQVLSRYPQIQVVAKEYCLSDTRLAVNLTRKIIEEKSPVDVIVALNSFAAVGVSQVVDEMNLENRVKVVAFDSIAEEIDFLDKDVIQATIVQNPFNIGYLGIKHAVEAMQGKKIPKRVDTGIKIIDKNNMYLPENQKLLFPFIK